MRLRQDLGYSKDRVQKYPLNAAQNRFAARPLAARFMPVKLREWSVNNQVTFASHFKTKIMIGECALQAFVESPNR